MRQHDKCAQGQPHEAIDLGPRVILDNIALEEVHAREVHAHAHLDQAECPEDQVLVRWHDYYRQQRGAGERDGDVEDEGRAGDVVRARGSGE